jgi:hypothetical protein
MDTHGKTMSKGEYRVGISFNPSEDDLVGQIKRQAADLIDLIDSIPEPKDAQWGGEIVRLKAQAQRELEGATMWAVKAATKPRME